MKNDQNKALYTKYRPKNFNDVIGQDHIVSVIKSALKQGNVAHAYLFSGSRGTGKTSVARILAHEIGTTEKDLYEIDAASNNGVDEIRRLSESVLTLPFDSKYKVYILDEVHMLSKSAFNALLKTLEEPPKHVVFILATTEPEKLPETVISRCESYEFRSPNRTVLKKMMIDIAEKESYKLEPAAAELIAVLGDGSFRDAQMCLQKLIRSSEDKKLTIEEVERVMGAPKMSLVNDVVLAFLKNDSVLGLEAIKQASENNIEVKVFMKLLIDKIRISLILKVAPQKKNLYQDVLAEEDLNTLSKIVEENKEKINSKILAKILSVYDECLRSPLPYLPVEVALIEMS